MRHVWTPEARFRAGEAIRRKWREMSPEERRIEGAKISARQRKPLSYCTVTECEYPAECRNLCGSHYRQLLRHGRIKNVYINRWSTIEAVIKHIRRRK